MKINNLIKDKICYSIIEFFIKHPCSLETIEGISDWLDESEADVKKAIVKLQDLEILEEHTSSHLKGYCLTQNENILKHFESFFGL